MGAVSDRPSCPPGAGFGGTAAGGRGAHAQATSLRTGPRGMPAMAPGRTGSRRSEWAGRGLASGHAASARCGWRHPGRSRPPLRLKAARSAATKVAARVATSLGDRPGLYSAEPMPKPCAPCEASGAQIVRPDPADRKRQCLGRKHRTPRPQRSGTEGLEGEHLDPVSPCLQRGEGFGRRGDSGKGDQSALPRCPDDLGVAIGRDHHAPARIGEPVTIIHGQGRARPDHRLPAERGGDPLDASERIGRIERDFDQGQPRVDQGARDLHGLFGAQAPEDGDQAAAVQGVFKLHRRTAFRRFQALRSRPRSLRHP